MTEIAVDHVPEPYKLKWLDVDIEILCTCVHNSLVNLNFSIYLATQST